MSNNLDIQVMQEIRRINEKLDRKKFELSKTGPGGGLDADTVDTFQAAQLTKNMAKPPSALIYLPFDGSFQDDKTGLNPGGNSGGNILRPGKFGNAVQVSEAVTNLIINPSFEVDAANWAVSNCTLAASAEKAFYGTKSGKVTITTPNCGIVAGTPVTAGQPYTFSAWYYTEKMTSDVGLVINWYNGVTFVAQITNIGTVTLGRWKKVILTGTAPATTTRVDAYFVATSGLVGEIIYVDGFQVENRAYASPYCDGSLGQGHAWTGTANASTSTRSAGYMRYTVNLNLANATFRYWVYNDGTAKGSNSVHFEVFDSGGSNKYYAVLQNSSANQYILNSYNGSGYVNGSPASPIYSTEGWHQVVVTLAGGNLYFYVDGAYLSTIAAPPAANYTNLYIGVSAGSVGRMDTLLDDLVVLDTAWTAAQVLADFEKAAPAFDHTVNAEIWSGMTPATLALTGPLTITKDLTASDGTAGHEYLKVPAYNDVTHFSELAFGGSRAAVTHPIWLLRSKYNDNGAWANRSFSFIAQAYASAAQTKVFEIRDEGAIAHGGTTFPTYKNIGDTFFKTDAGYECYWDGTYWLTKHEYQLVYPMIAATVSGNYTFGAIRADYQFYATRCLIQINAAGPQDATNYWGIYFRSINAGYGAATTLYSVDTKSMATGVYVDKSGAPPVKTDATNKYFLDWGVSKAGSAGAISFLFASIYYRLIVG